MVVFKIIFMRLSQEKAQFLKNQIQKYLPEAKVYLFGSRVSDSKKGGDIDILILGDRVLNWKEKGDIKNIFWQHFGLQKLDIVSFTHEDQTPFKKITLFDAVLL